MQITSVPNAKQTHWWGNQKHVLRNFYTKYLDVEGIAIIGSDDVDDNIFYKAKDIILKVTSKHLQFRSDLSGTRFMLAAPGTFIQSLPELRNFRHSPYGYSCISTDGVVHFCASVVEWESNPNMGVFTHELGHAISPTMYNLEPNFHNLLTEAYSRAIELGTWINERVSINMGEYWAEGVRMWCHDIGAGRRFKTKEIFREHDLGLGEILDNWLPVGEILPEY